MDYCNNGDFLKFILIIKNIINIIEIVVPIMLLVLGTVDFAKAVISGDDAMKKAQKTFTNRLLAAVIIFVVPFMVNVFMKMINDVLKTSQYEIPVLTTASSCYTNANRDYINSLE